MNETVVFLTKFLSKSLRNVSLIIATHVQPNEQRNSKDSKLSSGYVSENIPYEKTCFPNW